MIIHYNIPFSGNRKLARTYCKLVQVITKPFSKYRLLLDLNANSIDYREIPVIINNYNRINHLLQLIAWLEKAGMRHIFIIDNASSYPPLLDFYKTTPHTVIQLSANIGYKSIWDTNIHLWFRGLPYIYTDPDVLPIENCPLNAVEYFQQILTKNPEITKVGFGIKTDDIPGYFRNKETVLKWELKFWDEPYGDNLYKADIDTTFALYRENTVKQQWGKTLRTSGKYMVRHLPWYENEENISDEEKYYREKAVTTTWYSKKWLKKH